MVTWPPPPLTPEHVTGSSRTPLAGIPGPLPPCVWRVCALFQPLGSCFKGLKETKGKKNRSASAGRSSALLRWLSSSKGCSSASATVTLNTGQTSHWQNPALLASYCPVQSEIKTIHSNCYISVEVRFSPPAQKTNKHADSVLEISFSNPSHMLIPPTDTDLCFWLLLCVGSNGASVWEGKIVVAGCKHRAKCCFPELYKVFVFFSSFIW